MSQLVDADRQWFHEVFQENVSRWIDRGFDGFIVISRRLSDATAVFRLNDRIKFQSMTPGTMSTVIGGKPGGNKSDSPGGQW